MSKLKVMTIVGTRPEIIRLSRLIAILDKNCDHSLVHTGQNYDYELNQIFFDEMQIRCPDKYLNAAGDTVSQTIGEIIKRIDIVLEEYKPHAVVILGDTNSCLAALSVKKKKIPIFHLEAGNRCFDSNVPEEINRKIVDHIADINLVYSQIAREYLMREGFPPDQIIKIGSPLREVLKFYEKKIDSTNTLERLGINKFKYLVVSFHREENVNNPDRVKRLIDILNNFCLEYREPVIFSVHPRTRLSIESMNLTINPLIKLHKPFGYFDYIQLQKNARCVLSDSGSLTEESSILNFPALSLRTEQERPEGFEEGSVMFVGLNSSRIFDAIIVLEEQSRGDKRTINIVKDYDVMNFSNKVLRIIYSYIDFVNNKVWKKPIGDA